jgi:hypothetical protein
MYKRYTDSCLLLAVLFGPALIKAPTVVARPILAFRDDPLNLHGNALLLLAWFSIVIVWAKVHRPFVQGGAFPIFARTAPIPITTLRLIDIWMLFTGMCLFFIPFLVSAYVAVTAATDAGAGFACYFVLLLAVTFSVAKDVMYGAGRAAWGAHLLTLLVLFSPPPLDPLLRHWAVIGIAAVVELANLFSARAETRAAQARPLARLHETLAAQPALVYMMTNYARFFGAHWHDLVSRILWSLLPLYFAWWLIDEAGNHRDAPIILHLALGAFVGILSGAYKVLLVGRVKLTRFARSTGHGERILALFDHLLVLSPAVLCITGWLAVIDTLGMFGKLHLLVLSGFYLCVLALLGLQRIQDHKQAVVIRFILVLAGTTTAANII